MLNTLKKYLEAREKLKVVVANINYILNTDPKYPDWLQLLRKAVENLVERKHDFETCGMSDEMISSISPPSGDIYYTVDHFKMSIDSVLEFMRGILGLLEILPYDISSFMDTLVMKDKTLFESAALGRFWERWSWTSSGRALPQPEPRPEPQQHGGKSKKKIKSKTKRRKTKRRKSTRKKLKRSKTRK